MWWKHVGFEGSAEESPEPYYDKGYDCYDSAEFEIPLDIVEKELSEEGNGDETLVWYKGIIEDAYKRKQTKIKEREDRKKTNEYQQYLKLKEKYEEGKLNDRWLG